MQWLQSKRVRVASELFWGVTFLIFGCAIYLLFRSKSLNIYRWCSSLGISEIVDNIRLNVYDWNIGDVIRYSLPDGLYCAAYILFIDAIWHNDDGLQKDAIISFIPFVTICNEVLQYFGVVWGTFDIYDLLCYTLPLLIYFSVKILNNVILNYYK